MLYCRISDARNDTRGVDGQVADLRRHAERLGWGIGHIAPENDTSAFQRRKVTLPDGRRALRVVRPGWRDAIDGLSEGRYDGLLAMDLDRACRDPRDLEDLIDVVEMSRPRLPVESVTGSLRLATDADVTMARVMVAMANKSSRDTGRRVADARRRVAEAGQFKANGIRPFGFEKDGVTPRPVEQAEIIRAADALLAGVSLNQVVASMRERGISTVSGKPWTTSTLRGILRRPRNAGLLVYQGAVLEDHPAPWEPVLERSTWEAVVALLNDESRRTSPGNRPRHLGSCLYECGHPDHDPDHRPTMRVSARSHGYPVYRCRETSHCQRSERHLDGFVERVIVERLSRPDAADLLTPVKAGESSTTLQREADRLRQRRREARDLYDAEVLTAAELKVRDAKLRAELADVERRLAGTPDRSPLAGLVGPDAATVWAGLDLGRKRAVLKELMTVVVLPGARPQVDGGEYFDRDSVQIIWKAGHYQQSR